MTSQNAGSPAIEGVDFEVRADYVDEAVLQDGTVTTDLYDQVHAALVDKSMCLVVGPRGCGKTHMMRYTWLKAVENRGLPLTVYVSFNRYLRLEPFLKTKVNALTYFQTWVLCRIVHAMQDLVDRLPDIQGFDVAAALNLKISDIESLIARLERAATLNAEEERSAAHISIDAVKAALTTLCTAAGRSRCVLLLDDAALTLTPEYLIEFFELVRSLKTSAIAPKCSVYPGTTEYGPRFHARQEAREIPVWLPPDDPSYLATMLAIGAKRLGPISDKVSEPSRKQLAYAAFGMPRAYLSLLREISTAQGQQQQLLNKAIQRHRDGILLEYKSLATKVPQFRTLVDIGSHLFSSTVDALRDANIELKQEKQLLIGIERDDFGPLSERMTKLLIEAGLLFEHAEVSHGGPDRTYRRFTPHLAALIAVRAFSGGSRGQSASEITEHLQRKSAKHPVRRKLDTLLSKKQISSLRIDLPPCQKCGTPRVSEDQKFCHECGAQLTDGSNFTRLMSLSLDSVPGLTQYWRESMKKLKVLTIGHLLALSDPGTELRTVKYIGPVRSEQIIARVQAYIDEFLS